MFSSQYEREESLNTLRKKLFEKTGNAQLAYEDFNILFNEYSKNDEKNKQVEREVKSMIPHVLSYIKESLTSEDPKIVTVLSNLYSLYGVDYDLENDINEALEGFSDEDEKNIEKAMEQAYDRLHPEESSEE